MKISPTTEEDFPVLAELINAAYLGSEASKGTDVLSKGWTNEENLVDGRRMNLEHSNELQSSQTISVLKLEEDGKILGCVRLEQQGDIAIMSMLSVWPSSQAKGVGSRLIDAGEDWAKSRGCTSIKIAVISVRTPLLNYYKRRNYQETGEVIPFPLRPGHSVPKIAELHLIGLKKNLQ